MDKAYTFSDVLIKPKYSEIESRSKVFLNTLLGHTSLNIPILSANMKTITGAKMAATIASLGGLGLLHRFCTVKENIEMYREAFNISFEINQFNALNNIGVSIGVKEEEKKRFEALFLEGVSVFCIDVAHGHHILVKNMLQWINNYITPEKRHKVTIIAGNIATADGYKALLDWGADVCKCGTGSSPVCRTRYNTGVGVPQLYALEKVYEESAKHSNPIAIIADGGITHVGDIAKALKFADAVMLGSMISGTSETPGHVFRNEDGEFYKIYGGSASGENKGENNFVEGIIKSVKFKGKVKYIIKEITEGLQSAFSYTGSHNLKEFQQDCEFIHISSGSQKESKI